MNLESLEVTANQYRTCVQFLDPFLDSVEEALDKVGNIKDPAKKLDICKQISRVIDNVKSMNKLSPEDQKKVDDFRQRNKKELLGAKISFF